MIGLYNCIREKKIIFKKFQSIYEACVGLVIKDWDGCNEDEVRSRLNNIITNLNLMDQMFDNQTTINNLQTAYDICLNARYTYEFWLTDKFRFVVCTIINEGKFFPLILLFALNFLRNFLFSHF